MQRSHTIASLYSPTTVHKHEVFWAFSCVGRRGTSWAYVAIRLGALFAAACTSTHPWLPHRSCRILCHSRTSSHSLGSILVLQAQFQSRPTVPPAHVSRISRRLPAFQATPKSSGFAISHFDAHGPEHELCSTVIEVMRSEPCVAAHVAPGGRMATLVAICERIGWYPTSLTTSSSSKSKCGTRRPPASAAECGLGARRSHAIRLHASRSQDSCFEVVACPVGVLGKGRRCLHSDIFIRRPLLDGVSR